jgi:hypothetical protein
MERTQIDVFFFHYFDCAISYIPFLYTILYSNIVIFFILLNYLKKCVKFLQTNIGHSVVFNVKRFKF